MARRLRRLAAAAVVAASAVAIAGAAAPAAHAGLLVASAGDCATEELERPFLRWLDVAQYVLTPGGTFEEPRAVSRWELGAAEVVAGNEPFYVHARGERRSLSIPGGTRVTTPVMCVGVEHPTLRLVARNHGSVLQPLAVAVNVEDAAGRVHTLPIGAVAGTSRWAPSLPLPVLANLLPLLPGERTPVSFSFTVPRGSAGWQVDDVYVDPYSKN